MSGSNLEKFQTRRKALERRREQSMSVGGTAYGISYSERRDKTIVLDRRVDLYDRSKWPEYVTWLADRVAKFKKAFEPRVKKLDRSISR